MIARAVEACIKALQNGNKLMFVGNGGSCSQAEHLACEFIGSGLPAIALTNSSIITALGNDIGFDEIFSQQIWALAKEGDILFALSTSGQSQNVMNAVLMAHDKGCRVIALTGRHTPLTKIADIAIEFDGDTQEIQEQTIKAGHTIWRQVSNAGMA